VVISVNQRAERQRGRGPSEEKNLKIFKACLRLPISCESGCEFNANYANNMNYMRIKKFFQKLIKAISKIFKPKEKKLETPQIPEPPRE